VPGLARLMPSLRCPVFATVRGRVYGVPFDYGPNLLLFNARVLRRAPTSWRTTWFPSPRLAGRVTRYTSSIYLADAALYLWAHQPALGIRDPYELIDAQLGAAAGFF